MVSAKLSQNFNRAKIRVGDNEERVQNILCHHPANTMPPGSRVTGLKGYWCGVNGLF